MSDDKTTCDVPSAWDPCDHGFHWGDKSNPGVCACCGAYEDTPTAPANPVSP